MSVLLFIRSIMVSKAFSLCSSSRYCSKIFSIMISIDPSTPLRMLSSPEM